MLSKINGDRPFIGVIGGVGPYAGLDFIRKIFSNTIASKDQDHLNCLLISCPSIIPDRTEFLLQGNGENPAYGLFESARCLYIAGVRYAVVACNTAHSCRIFPLSVAWL
jgi:aspartate racemase